MSNHLNGFNYASIFGVFLGGVGIYFSFEPLLIGFWEMIKIALIFYVIWFLIPLKVYTKFMKISKWEVVLFLLLAASPIVLTSFFMVNRFIPSESIVSEYKIESSTYFGFYGETNNLAAIQEIRYDLEGDSLRQFPRLRTFNIAEFGGQIPKVERLIIEKKIGYLKFPFLAKKGVD